MKESERIETWVPRYLFYNKTRTIPTVNEQYGK